MWVILDGRVENERRGNERKRERERAGITGERDRRWPDHVQGTRYQAQNPSCLLAQSLFGRCGRLSAPASPPLKGVLAAPCSLASMRGSGPNRIDQTVPGSRARGLERLDQICTWYELPGLIFHGHVPCNG